MTTTRSKALTLRVVVLGVGLAIILGAANAYLGLFAGMTVSGSVPAAVMSMAIFGTLGAIGLRRATIQENNLVQTAASAGEALVAGMIFTLPALFILGFWQEADYSKALLILLLGGVLGVLFAVPLRRALVIDEGLRYPEGRATAEILKMADVEHTADGVQYKGVRGLFQRLIIGAVIGAVVKLASKGLALFPNSIQGAVSVGGAPIGLAVAPAPSLLGVGYILGHRIALVVGLGGLTAWFVLVPLAVWVDPVVGSTSSESAVQGWDLAKSVWLNKIRYVGVGAMFVGGLWALLQLARPVARAVRSLADASLHQQDLPLTVIVPLGVLCVVPLFLLYQSVLGATAIATPMTALMVVLGFVFCAVAAWMTGTVGSSSNPVSGMTIATITLTSLLLLWLTGANANSAAAAIMIGGVVCTAAAISGDTMQDLAAGHFVGATPWMQQVMQLAGVLAAALVMPLVLVVLHAGYGFAGEANPASDTPLSAPQAALMATVVQGVLGDGDLQWRYIALGALLALPVGIVDEILRRRSQRRLPILAVAVGAYLPLYLIITIMLGGLISRLTGGTTQRGTLLAAGLITGEALLGIGLAIPVAITGNPSLLPLVSGGQYVWLAAAVLGILVITLWALARNKSDR